MFLPRDGMLKRGLCCRQVSVRPSVCHQRRIQEFSFFLGGTAPFPLSPSLPLPSPPFSPPFPSPPLSYPTLPSPPLPLEVGPLNPAGGLGERCKLPQQVRAEPGRQTHFGAF